MVKREGNIEPITPWCTLVLSSLNESESVDHLLKPCPHETSSSFTPFEFWANALP